MFEQELLDRSLLDFNVEANRRLSKIDAIKNVVGALKPRKYFEIIDEIYNKALTKEAYKGKDIDSKVDDLAFTIIYRILRDTKDFLTIRATTRKGDVS